MRIARGLGGQIRKHLLPTLFVSALIATVTMLFRLLFGVLSGGFEDGFSLDDALSLWDEPAQVHVTIGFAVVVIAVLLILILLRRVRPYLGQKALDEHRQELFDGLRGQATWIEQSYSWPRHQPAAKPAIKPYALDFGDAEFTTSKAAQRSIRSLLKKRWGRTPKNLDACLVLITGEPGGGKSTLTQEIHYSIATGVTHRHHSLVPVVVLAEGLTKEVLEESNLPRCLSRYLRNSGRPSDTHIAAFIESHWSDYDFLIIVDGLDEIAQRSLYEPLQRRLKELFESELSLGRSVSRRFILSCRTDDDIGIFTADRQITLRGLTRPSDRRRFTEHLIARSGLGRDERRGLTQALTRGTSSLVGLDVYRRNPYFLVLLLDHIKETKGAPLDSGLDFDFLMQQHIAREADRIELGDGSKSRRKKLRDSYIDIASVMLQFAAFSMSSGTKPGSLYGRLELDESFFQQFLASVRSAKRAAVKDGQWMTIASLVDALGSDRGLHFTATADHVGYGDLFELNGIASAHRLGEITDEQSIERTFATIISVSGYDQSEWAKFSTAVFGTTSPFFDNPHIRAAAWIYARGLAGAYALRLIYLEERDGKFSIRFRHRRIAEYFAAKYFEQRWEEVGPKEYSPWLSNVLNLVCALEKERASAFAWLVDRVKSPERERHLWRAEMFAATEASAFTSEKPPRGQLATQLAERLVSSLIAFDKEAQHDMISRIATIKSLEVLASTGVSASNQSFAEMVRLESGQASQTLVYTARAIHAAETLTGARRPFLARMVSLQKSLLHPGAVVLSGTASSAAMRFEKVVCVIALFAAEAFLLIGSYLLGTSIATVAYGWFPLLPDPVHLGTAACLTVLVHRLSRWLAAPMSMDRIVRVASQGLFGTVKAVWLPTLWITLLPIRVVPWIWNVIQATWRSAPAALDAAAKLPDISWELAVSGASTVGRGARALPGLLWGILVKLVQLLLALAVMVAIVWMVLYFSSASPKNAAPALASGSTATTPKVDPGTVGEEVVAAPASKQPDTCKVSEIHSDPPLAVSLPENPTPQIIDALRSQLSTSVDRWERDWTQRCPELTEEITRVRDATLTNHLASNPMLMLKPNSSPTFDSGNAATLIAAIETAQVELPTLQSLPGLMRSMDLEEDLLRQVELLSSARLSGTITGRTDGIYETDEQFPHMAVGIATLLTEATEALADISSAKEHLRNEIFRFALSLLVGIPFLYAAFSIARGMLLRRAENAEMSAMDRMTISELAESLRSGRTTDRARRYAVGLVQDSATLTSDDLFNFERMASELTESSHYRDRLFVTELLERLASLSHRVVRNTA